MTPRTLEVMDYMGLHAEIHERGRPVHGMNLWNGKERLAHVELSAEGTPYPFVLGISQRDTELVLKGHLERLGGRLERPLTLTGFEQNDDGVLATLAHPSGGTETVQAKWLVGCDGAKSTVREVLGFPFEGSTFEQNVIQADIKVDFPFEVPAGEGAMFLSQDGAVGVLPVLGEGRHRVIMPNMPDPDAEASLEVFEAILRTRAPEGTRVHDPAWIAKFRFHGRIVPRYRERRVFLAGDAAHIHSPIGGQGMNMGIQDAYNLAWKLALVAQGAGRPLLLDSYDPERRPVARATVTGTDRGTRALMRMVALRSSVAEALRNQAIAFLVGSGLLNDRAFYAIGQLGVTYAKSPAVGEHQVSVWSAEIGSHATEQPGVADWIGFSRAIGKGERVPDVDLTVPGGRTLFELLRGTEHVLFLFDGAAATTEGYANLSRIAAHVTARYGKRIRTFVVVPRRERPSELAALEPATNVILDEDRTLHEHFGCSTEALYLVRPDGHVGFRSQPAVLEKLQGYLETIFVGSPS
jgi:2-polyprenyl-6-methoxyphenol hydroxylase-like FAD-dependent oxidoreductase